MTNTTQHFFDGYAPGFNSIYSNRNTLANRLINHTFRKSMELRYVKTLQGCHPIEGKRVLDLGCGPGHYGIALARAGAAQVLGIDFAEGMIDLARKQAEAAGVAARCAFVSGDFYDYEPDAPFDYIVVMGVMDYIANPAPLIAKVLSMTRERAFFSFPAAGGFLGWQRKLRYRHRCPLFLYTHSDVEKLFLGVPDADVRVEPIARDFFVRVSKRLQNPSASASIPLTVH